jgi:hypothetical protein
MKFIDKIKNYFYDDEEDENDLKLKEVRTPDVNQDATNSKSENEKNVSSDEKLDVVSERELFKSDPSFNFPIIFDEDDFEEEKAKKESINERKFEQNKVVGGPSKKVFTPSLNISPVYGVISDDKKDADSKKKEDNLFSFYDEKKKVDIDDVLGKVYPPSRTELKSDNYQKVDIEPVVESDLSIDLFDNDSNSIIEEPIAKIDEKLKSIDELLEDTESEDFYSLVDSMYKEEDNEGDLE